MSKKIGYRVALLGAVAGAGALATALFKKKKQEALYREAEIKAMNELDGVADAACEDDDCADCSCAQACAAMDSTVEPVVEATETVVAVDEEKTTGSPAGQTCDFEELRVRAEETKEKIREYAAAELDQKPEE